MAYILLGAENKVLHENIQHKLEASKKEPCDAKLYDFDDVFYRIFIAPDDRSKMTISLETPNWEAIRSHGSEDLVKSRLSEYVTDCTNDGMKFTINLDDSKSQENADAIGQAFSKLRVYALGGPLYEMCKALQSGKPMTKAFDFPLRRDTHCWLVPKKDRVACVFGMEFPIKSDRIIAHQVLHEFIEVRRQRDLANTPVVSFSTKDAPMELKGLKQPPVDASSFLGYFSVLLLPEHIKTDDKLWVAIEQTIGFRSYLTYHIKCAKAFFHQRMRARVKSMLQVLNRARYEPDDTRKKKKIIKGAK